MSAIPDSITVLVNEEKYPSCRNYLGSGCTVRESYCHCADTQRLLHVLEECALLVTDPTCIPSSKALATRPLTVYSSSPKSTAVRATRTLTATTRTTTTTTTPPAMGPAPWNPKPENAREDEEDCQQDCPVCGKPQHQQQQYEAFLQQDILQTWRQQMFEWTCQVVDSFRVRDSTGVMALSFALLDRYMEQHVLHRRRRCRNRPPPARQEMSDQHPINLNDFQLISMTTLFIAVKFLEGKSLSITTMVEMSRGRYRAEDFVVTERDILSALQWRINIPTAIQYCRLILEFWTTGMSPSSDEVGFVSPLRPRQRIELEACCATLTEIAILDASFLSYPTSLVAMVSVVLASRLHGISLEEINRLRQLMNSIIDTSERNPQYLECYQRLERIYCQ